MESKGDISHARTKRFAGNADIVDRSCRRKDAGKKRMQCAAIIGVVLACAAVRMQASVMAMAIGAMRPAW